jgi:hypothetical protein
MKGVSMEKKVALDKVYVLSEDIVSRKIDNDLVIIPIKAGIADEGDALYTLNETAAVVWGQLNGKKSLSDIVKVLGSKFSVSSKTIERDVLGITRELLKRGFIFEANK